MSALIIYHNGECSKSKGALELLQDKGIAHSVRWYLVEPLNKEELASLLGKLGLQPSALVRKSEALYKDEYEGRQLSEEDWMEILSDNPVLMERPIVENGIRAVIARPAERVLEII